MITFKDHLKILTDFLNSEKCRYAILGGVAVAIYGEPRLTADIDANIILNKNDISLFLKLAKKYGIYPRGAESVRTANETGVLVCDIKKVRKAVKCDLIIAENMLEYNAINRARFKTIAGLKIKLITPEDLVIHKITSSRPRDLDDLAGILTRQEANLDFGYIRKWLNKIDKAVPGAKLWKTFQKLLKGR